LRRANATDIRDEALRGWQAACDGEVTVVRIASDHDALLQPPAVDQVAAELCAAPVEVVTGGVTDAH
jgi:thioesterase domain-containing protein